MSSRPHSKAVHTLPQDAAVRDQDSASLRKIKEDLGRLAAIEKGMKEARLELGLELKNLDVRDHLLNTHREPVLSVRILLPFFGSSFSL